MKNFIKNNHYVITIIIFILIFFKSCNDSRQIAEIKKEINNVKEVTYTKDEFNNKLELLEISIQLEGLLSEKRMIQSTDRKLFDLNRQNEVDKEILEKIKEYEDKKLD